jgi:hypothetical protein
MAFRKSLKNVPPLKWLVLFFRVLKRKRGVAVTIQAFVGFSREWSTYRTLPRNPSFTLMTSDLYPRLFDNTQGTPVDPVYFYQDAWCAKKIFEMKPTHHVDVASHLPTIGIISQFVPTTMVDIRPPTVALPELSFVQGSLLHLPFNTDSILSLSSICVIEHVGLGRYGDALDQFGSEKSVRELTRVLAKNGNLYISVPVDTENKVYFNAHRAFTRAYILDLCKSLSLIEEKYVYGNTVYDSFDALKGFGTGLYHFKKL